MANVMEIYHSLDCFAPFSTQMDFDNAGFLVGRGGRTITKVLVSLDITEDVVHEAAEIGAELIVSHHPIIFLPVHSITDGDPVGRTVLSMVEHGIAAICAHTNLDAAIGGVNDALAQTLRLSDLAVLEPSGVNREGLPIGIGRVGLLIAQEYSDLVKYAEYVKCSLGAHGVRYVDAGRVVHRVAVGGGACGDMLKQVLAMGCDTFVTSDVKYNQFLDAKAMGLNLIDAGHYPTENVVCPVISERLKAAFPNIEVQISACHQEVFSYL